MIAALVIHFFPQSRGSGVNQTKAALYIYNGSIPIRTAIGKFITAALGHRVGAFPGPGRSIPANWGMPGFGARSADAIVAGPHAPDCPGGRGGGTGGGI